MSEYLFPYEWTLKDAVFTKDKGKVASTFSCGGGSTMGYKLAGYDVIAALDIDPKMMACYVENHRPKYHYIQSITEFKLRKDLPKELYDLDILDGSPPCSSFSMSGNRGDDWGKEKKFREGQADQVLDTLFFDHIDLLKELKPKAAVMENVKGILLGEAKEYVRKIYKEVDKAGYYCQHFLLDASKMGVPQRRERVFFICLRKDLAGQFLYQKDMFTLVPKIDLNFNLPEIPFKNIDSGDIAGDCNFSPFLNRHWEAWKPGSQYSEVNGSGFNYIKADPNRSISTILAHPDSGTYHHIHKRQLNSKEYILAGSYPKDYNFLNEKPKYLVGMSVPPLMTAHIASCIYDQWLSKINIKEIAA